MKGNLKSRRKRRKRKRRGKWRGKKRRRRRRRRGEKEEEKEEEGRGEKEEEYILNSHLQLRNVEFWRNSKKKSARLQWDSNLVSPVMRSGCLDHYTIEICWWRMMTRVFVDCVCWYTALVKVFTSQLRRWTLSLNLCVRMKVFLLR